MKLPGGSGWRTAAPTESVPTGIAVGFGAVAMVAAGLVAAAVPANQPGWRFAIVAITVGLFAAASADHVALAVVALLGFLISNGFLENRLGELSWHGSADLWRLMLLVSAGAWGLAVGDAYRWVRGLRAYRREVRPVVMPRQATTPAGGAPYLLMKEEEHGA
jgi:hypothetical protein